MDIFVFVFRGEIKCIICTLEISSLWLGFSTSMCHQLLYQPNGSGAVGKRRWWRATCPACCVGTPFDGIRISHEFVFILFFFIRLDENSK